MAKSVVLEAKNVKKTFHLGKEDLEVLKEINLEIHSGEYVIFFGPSGCGKSTLLNVLSGLEPPTEGQLLVRGESLYKKSQKEITDYRRSKIGIVFQQFNLLKALTIQENIALPLAAAGEGYKKRMDRAAHLLDMVGLKKYMKHGQYLIITHNDSIISESTNILYGVSMQEGISKVLSLQI